MAGNLNVAVTVDATQARVGLAQAQADLRAYGATLRQVANEARTAGGEMTAAQAQQASQSASGYNTAKAAITGYRTELGEVTAAERTHRSATEAMVLVHEALSGRMSKMGGSLMILTQQLSGGSAMMMAFGGAMAVAALGAMHLAEWLGKVSQAKMLAEAGGLGSGIGNAALDAEVSQINRLSGVTSEMAGQVVHAFAEMRGISAYTLKELDADVHGLALRMGIETPAAAAKIAEAWNLDGKAGAALLESTRASGDVITAFNKAAGDNDAIKARSILLEQLHRNEQEVGSGTRLGAENSSAPNALEAGAISALGAEAGQPNLGAQMVDQAKLDDATASAQRLQYALSAVSGEMKTAEPESWSDRMRTELDKLTLATEQGARQQGMSWQQTHQAMAQTAVDFWQKELATTRDGTKQHEEAERSLYQAEETLELSKIRLSTEGATKQYAAAVASFDRQIAAARGNLQEIESLEAQKLAYIKSVHGEASAEYQRAQKEETETVRQAVTEQVRVIEKAGQDRLKNQKAVLAQELASEQITKAQELQSLQQFLASERDAELQALAALKESLDSGSAAYREANQAQSTTVERFGTLIKQTDAEIAADTTRTADHMVQEYERAFSQIGSTAERTVAGLITGQMTWQRAASQVANSVVESAVNLAAKVVERWLAAEVAKTLITDQQTIRRVLADQAAGNTGWTPILAHWLGLETAKTAATRTGAAVRSTADSSGGLISEIGSILASWLGLETAKTGATVAQNTVRTADSATADVTATFAAAQSNAAEVVSYAAVGAAAAGASVAAIPYVGWAMAPEVADETFGILAAFAGAASLDTGAWSIPGDMPANLHAGEAVLPVPFADAFRAAVSGGGSGGGGGATFNVYAIDAQGVAAFFNRHGRTIAGVVAGQMSRNPSLRPSF